MQKHPCADLYKKRRNERITEKRKMMTKIKKRRKRRRRRGRREGRRWKEREKVAPIMWKYMKGPPGM